MGGFSPLKPPPGSAPACEPPHVNSTKSTKAKATKAPSSDLVNTHQSGIGLVTIILL